MAKITIICGDDTYRLSYDGNESDEAEYGDPAFLEAGRRKFMALVCEDDHGVRYSLLDGDDWALEIKGSVDVEFEEAEEEEETEPELEETDDAGDSEPDDTENEPDTNES
jgi:hypothetical protein